MNTPTALHRAHRRLALLLTLISAAFSLPTPAGAQSPVIAPVPPVINYQGRVTDATGLPIGATGPVSAPVPGTTNRKIIFRIWDAATGGTRLWTEEQTVTIATGEFSVLLGSGINATGTAAGESRPSLEAVFNSIGSTPGTARYLEIMVDEGGGTIDASDVPISPRQQLTTTAYSFRARSADSIASGTDLQLNGSSNYGLGYYGAGRTFNGTTLDGPVLYGLSGGALGSVNGASQNTALRWNATGQVGVGSADLSGADASSKLVLQGDDAGSPPKQLTIRGNTTSKRLFLGYNTTSNYGALQAYNGTSTATNLLLNPVGGTVGIGTTNPTSGAKLEVSGLLSGTTISATTSVSAPAITANVINLPTTTSATVGVLNQNSVPLIHTKGTENFFAGAGAGNFTVSGDKNTAVGDQTLQLLSSGNKNVAIGFQALKSTSTGTYNSAVGYRALEQNAGGNYNTATGSLALLNNASGDQNTVVGYFSLYRNTTGNKNTVLGSNAGYSMLSGSENIFVGYNSGYDVTGSNNICIGNRGAASDAGIIRLGTVGTHTKTYIAGTVIAGEHPSGTYIEILGDAITRYYNGTADTMHINRYGGSVTLVGDSTAAKVGIGTASPSKGKLEVVGSSKPSIADYTQKVYIAGNPNHGEWWSGTADIDISIYADKAIAASQIVAYSDARIKNIERVSDGSEDLKTISQIEVTDYKYKDVAAKGAAPQKMLIAQQLETVYPQAVSRSTDVVPDIYEKAVVQNGWVQLATNLKKGERVRLIGEKEEGIHEVLEVGDGKFRTDFAPEDPTIFVYGREVNDFRTVDYNAVAMLNVSATQELARKLEAKDAEVKVLQEKVAGLAAVQKRLAELEARDQAREAKLVAIEKLLRSVDQPAVRTVSLKQGGGAE